MQPKNRTGQTVPADTPLEDILRGHSYFVSDGPALDLPEGTPAAQVLAVANGEMAAGDVTPYPNFTPVKVADAEGRLGGPQPPAALLEGDDPRLALGEDGLDLVPPTAPIINQTDTQPAKKNAEPHNDSPTTDQQGAAQDDGGSNGTRKHSPVVSTPHTGVHYPTKEEAVFAFFADVERLTQADPYNKKPEYGAMLLSANGSHEIGPFYYARVHKGISSKVNIKPEYDSIAMMHTHPPDSDLNAYKRDNDRANRRLSKADVSIINSLAITISEHLGEERKIDAYLANSDGDILHMTSGSLQGRGTLVPRSAKFVFHQK